MRKKRRFAFRAVTVTVHTTVNACVVLFLEICVNVVVIMGIKETSENSNKHNQRELKPQEKLQS